MGVDTEVGMEAVTMTTTEAEVAISAAVILEVDLVADSVKGSTVSEISIKEVRKKSKKSSKVLIECANLFPSSRSCQIPNNLTLYQNVHSDGNSTKFRPKFDETNLKIR